MASAASLYGNMPRQGAPIGTAGQAYDAGQVASASNMFSETTSLGAWSSGLNMAGQAIGAIGGAIANNSKLKAEASNYRAQARALTATRDRYISTYTRDTAQLDASQLVGYISSGLETNSGTPAAVRSATGYQRGLEMGWQVQNYNTDIRNLNKAASAVDKSRRIGNMFAVVSSGLGLVSGGMASGLF